MLGVRFFDIDFMRENLACASLLYRLYAFVAQSKRTMSGQHCHPRRPGRSARPRPVWQRKIGEPNRAPILQRAWPPVGGTFYFEMLVPAPLPKTCPKMVLSHKGGSRCVKNVFKKKFFGGGRD